MSISMLSILILLITGLFSLLSNAMNSNSLPVCNMAICESIPNDLTYDNQAPILLPTWKVWENIIKKSNVSIRIGSFYWTLLNNDVDNKTYFPTSEKGKMIFDLLLERSKSIPLEIVQNGVNSSKDLEMLSKNKLVKINFINFKKYKLPGIQHSKFWIGDNKTAYIGSANMDWRSLTEVKELGVYIDNCPGIVQDVDKFWQALQLLSGPNATIPSHWPNYMNPNYNHTHPLIANLNGVLSKIYTATSPPMFNPPYRTDDLTALIRTIKQAKSFIHISVMDMFPLIMGEDGAPNTYWPDIENELKRAALDRNVSVKLLISKWIHTNSNMLKYLRSLNILSTIKGFNIQVKIMIIPAFKEYQREVPFSRVSHSKYMVTDNTAYIGTSNWSGDYYNSCGGISLVSEEINPDSNSRASIRKTLNDVFMTDWKSIYAHDLN